MFFFVLLSVLPLVFGNSGSKEDGIEKLIDQGKDLSEILKNIKAVVHQPLENFIKNMNDDIDKINTRIETLTAEEKNLISEASLLIRKTSTEIYLLRLVLTNLAKETIQLSNIIITIFKNLNINEPATQIQGAIQFSAKRMISLFKKSHALLTQSMKMYTSISYNVTDVSQYLKSFKYSIKDIGNKASERMKKWIKKKRELVYGASAVCLIVCPPCCAIIYPVEAIILENIIKDHEVAVRGLQEEVVKATERVTDVSLKMNETQKTVYIEMKIISTWKREVDTLSGGLFVSVKDAVDFLKYAGKQLAITMLCNLDKTCLEYIYLDELSGITLADDPLLNEECKMKTKTKTTIATTTKNGKSGYVSLGCWKSSRKPKPIAIIEGTDSRLTGNYRERKNPVQLCFEVAAFKGYPAFAVQNGGRCAASSTALETYKKYGAATNCADGKGGNLANDVYKIQG